MLSNTIRQLLLIIICLWIITLPKVVMAQADKIYQENNQAVVVILTYNKEDKPLGQGSGFIVRSDGAIVTTLHGVCQAASIKIKVAKDKYLEVEGVLYTDDANDLAILKAKGKDLSVVRLGDSGKIKEGKKVYVIGGPISLKNSISDGQVSRIGQKEIEITALTSPGSSGGPVFNERGEVIGMVTSGFSDKNITFAMKINLVRTKINNTKILPLERIDRTKTVEYWTWKGSHLSTEGKYREAIESHQQAVRLKPSLARGHYNLGYAYAMLKDYEKAIASFKEAVRLKPAFIYAHDNLGNTYGVLGDYKKAIESYQQAIRFKPDYADAYYNLGNAYKKMGDCKKAVESYQQAIRFKPDDAEAHHNLGVIYGELGDYKKAIASFKQTIRIKPDYAEAHWGLGLAYLGIGNRSSASEEYKILKDLDKDLGNKLFNLIYGEK